jgi:hypothetical protein
MMNLQPYMHLRDGNDLEPMDERHVKMIHSVLVTECPGSVVNIGIANGFSSVATIQAILTDHVQSGFFIDLTLRECFKKLLPPLDPRFYTLETNSRDFHATAECWVIDGDHRDGAIVDYDNARKSQARIVIAHDTNEAFCPEHQAGAIEIGRRMKKDSVCYFEDWQDRPGELTKRGLTIAFYYQPKEETMRNLQELNR